MVVFWGPLQDSNMNHLNWNVWKWDLRTVYLVSCGENPTVLSKRPAPQRQSLLGIISSKSAHRSYGPVKAKAAHRGGSRTWQATWKSLLHATDFGGVKGSWRAAEAWRCGRFGVPTGRPKEPIGEGAALVTVGATEYGDSGTMGVHRGQQQVWLVPAWALETSCVLWMAEPEKQLPTPLESSRSVVCPR